MKKHKSIHIKTIVVSLALFALVACNKQLDDLRPHNVTFEEGQFSTPAGFNQAIVGTYLLLCGSATTTSFNYNDMQLYFSEALGDNLRVLDVNNNYYTDAFNYTNSSTKDKTYSYEYWRGSYKIILHLNKILAHIKNDEINPTILQVKAETLFLRAYVYFNMIRLYGMPYYNSPETNPGVMLILTDNNGINYSPGRSTVKEVYAQVVKDLTESIPLFKQAKSNSFASKYAAFALLSRVYLYMGKTFTTPDLAYNNKAIACADSVIARVEKGEYSLLQNAAYTAYYNTQNMTNKEDIFAISTTVKSGLLSNLYCMPSQNNYSGGLYRPSPSLLNLYSNNDLRKRFFITNVTPGYPEDDTATIKYRINYVSLYSNSPYRCLRLAEVYLNRAEAKVKTGDNLGALNDINIIRVRAGLTALTGISGTDLFVEILKQRRMELAFEGHNSYDYFRNGLPMIRDYASLSSDKITIEATNPKILLRIPEEEIIANPNLIQNK